MVGKPSRENHVQNSLVAGRRAAVRTAIMQVVVTLVLALLFWLLGPREAIAAVVGGTAAALGSALMAWRAVGGGVVGSGAALMRLLGGMALKWLVVLAALYWALAVARLPPGPLLVGLGAALVVPILNLKKQL